MLGKIQTTNDGGEMEEGLFMCYKVWQNRKYESQCCSCFLGKTELHCSSIVSVANMSANGPIVSSFEKKTAL